ncbi:hypothetical protein AC06_2130 [Escherichia coli 3-373-03_S3_C1]|nr:hypothetical protein AC06_2130 [Escherichia coli 3-373-03_S3_C1]
MIAKNRGACGARFRPATGRKNGVSSPASLYSVGIISSKPCDDVNDVERAPVCKAPCTVAIAPASDCISTTRGVSPQTFFKPFPAQASACSAIVELGVIG